MNWNKKTLYERIIDRWTELDTDYGKANPNRGLMAKLFRSDEIVNTNDKGELVGELQYNGSGSWYSRMMATGFQGSLVAKNTAWIRHMLEELELKGIDELDIWTQNITEHMSGAYKKSNFYDIQPQFTHDGLTTGSPVIFGEENLKKRKTVWKPQHYKNVRLYYDADNDAEGVIIEDKTWTAKKIFDTFIKEDDDNHTKSTAKLSMAVNTALEAGLLNDVFTVYRATFRVNDPIWAGNGESKFKKPKGDWSWLSAYFLELSDAEGDKRDEPLNDNMGDFSQPFAYWNFDKKPWEATSRTPAWYAIWDNMSLQQIDQNYLEDMQNINRPPYMALNTMKGRIDIGPEGQMFGSKEEYDRPPQFLNRVGGIQFSKDLMELKVDSLKRWFYIDQLQMFTDLTRTNKAPVAEYHLWQMAGEKATLLSPAIETHSRYLETTDARMVDIEARAGRGPFDPQTMGNITDIIQSNLQRPVSKVSILPVFIGQLAQAQKISQALKPIQDSMGALLQSRLLELFPDYKWIIKPYETINDIFEAFDFGQKNILPKDELEKLIAGLNQQRAEEAQFARTIEMAKASKDVSGKVEPDSVLGAVAGAAG